MKIKTKIKLLIFIFVALISLSNTTMAQTTSNTSVSEPGNTSVEKDKQETNTESIPEQEAKTIEETDKPKQQNTDSTNADNNAPQGENIEVIIDPETKTIEEIDKPKQQNTDPANADNNAHQGENLEVIIDPETKTIEEIDKPQTPEPETTNKDDNTKEEEASNQDKQKTEDGKPLSAKAIVVDLSSEKLEYNQEEDTFIATGSAKVIIAEENAELEANKVTYNQKEEIITAEGGLKVKKDGRIISGDYVKIDLKARSALIDNPNTIISKIRMTAKEANLYPDYIELEHGETILEQGNIDLSFSASEFKPQEIRDSLPGRSTVIPKDISNKKPNYKIVAKEIELDRSKKVNNLIVKSARIYIGKFKLITVPRMTLTVGDNAKVVEAMLPEVGFNKNIGGIYFGPSLTLELPKSSYLRVSPVFSAFGRDSDIGGGGIARFRSPINSTDVAYTSTGNRLVVKGEQVIYKDKTRIEYVVNEYPEQGFMGTGLYRPLYLAELVDGRKIGEVLNHNIFTRLSGGIARDVNDGIATSRIQFQSNIISDKPIFHLKDYIAFRLQSQVNFAYYGTGNTYTVLRGGPRVDWNAGRVRLTTAYFQAGIWGQTPFIFDKYIRGTCNLVLAGDLRLSKFFSVGNISNLNLRKDGYDPRLATENQFYVRVGPEDIKFRLGYDIVRHRTTFGVDLFLGSGRSAFSFDKLKILHPEMDLE